jgi:hypothetical protein
VQQACDEGGLRIGSETLGQRAAEICDPPRVLGALPRDVSETRFGFGDADHRTT